MPKPYTDLEKVKQVMELYEQGLTFRAIGEKLKKDVKTVYRWYLSGTGKSKIRYDLSIKS